MKCKITLFYLYNTTHRTKTSIENQALDMLWLTPKQILCSMKTEREQIRLPAVGILFDMVINIY